MTSRERVLTACRHRQPDRVPADVWFRDDVMRKFMDFLGVSDVESMLKRIGCDLRTASIRIIDPAFEQATNGVLGDAVELTGGRFIFHEKGIFEDNWGVKMRNGADGLYTEWIDGPFTRSEGIEDLDKYNWPSLDVIESQNAVTSRVQGIRAKGEYAIRGSISNPFKLAWQMRGMENMLCDMLLDPGFALDLMQRIAVYYKEMGLRLIRAGVDILGIVGDIASQSSLMFSLDVWRKTMKPVLADLIQAFRGENPNILMFFHSDGCLDLAMEELIETGFEIINPIQPECMDVFSVKDRYGSRITMHGTISIQKLLPFGTVEDVHREVRKIIDYCGREGGLIVSPSNLIQNDTPMENILALYEEINGTQLT